jgi:hypothetical protein
MKRAEDHIVPPLRAIAVLLSDTNPQALADLRARYPNHERLFEPAYVLGQEPIEAARSSVLQEVEPLRAFAEAGLTAAELKLEQLVAVLSKRIKRARSVKLAGAITASVSSVGVISALALAQSETALLTALVGLVSSIASLLGEHMEQPLIGGQKSLGELLGDALSAEGRARDLRVEFLGGAFGSLDAILSLATRVNEVAARVRAIVVYGGVATT